MKKTRLKVGIRIILTLCIGVFGMCMVPVRAQAAYNPNAAAQYALKYWNSRNPDYKDYSPNDCANFVSQCLSYGGLEHTSDWAPYNYRWNTAAIIYHLQDIGWQIIEKPSASQISVGDVLIYRWNANDTGYDHVGICTEVINGQPWVCAHTTDRHTSSWTMGAGKYWVAKSNNSQPTPPSSNYKPRGCIDLCTGGKGTIALTGWAFDQDTPKESVEIQAFIGGDAQSGAPRAVFKADKYRPDVNTAYSSLGVGNYHGFDNTVSTSKRGSQKVYVYAMNTGDGYDTLLGTKDVYIENVPNSIVCTDSDRTLNVGETKAFNIRFTGDGIYKVGGTVPVNAFESAVISELDYTAGTFKIKLTGKTPGNADIEFYFQDSAGQKFYTETIKFVVKSPLKGISLNKSATSLNVGNTEKLSVTYNPTNTTDTKTVTWTSSSTSVATVGTDGTITAKAPGTATITAKVGRYTASCTVTVKVPLKSISLNKTSTTLNVGGTDKLSVTYNPTNTTDSKAVTWTSSSTSVATVGSDGTITAKAPGSTTITAKVGSCAASCTVTVKAPLKGISLNKTSTTLNVGGTEKLSVTYNPTNTTDSKAVTWTSSSTSVATVGSDGTITAKAPGSTTITAKVGSSIASCTLTVKAPLKNISFNNNSLEMKIGDVEELVITYNPTNTTDSKTAVWSSSDSSVVIVSNEGKIVAIGEGSATVTATVGKCSATCDITVKPAAHVHQWSNYWMSDDTYHWRVCTDDECAEITDKEVHSYKKTTNKATPQSDGSEVYTCTECEHNKTSIIYRPMTVKLSTRTCMYSKEYKMPKVTLLNSKGKQIDPKYYTVSYMNNYNVGQATVIISLKGKYSGEMKTTFTIIPHKICIKSLKPRTKGFVVKWGAYIAQTGGYELQYSLDSSFAKKTTVKITDTSVSTKEIKNLQSKKKYYVRMRSYKYVTINGQKTKLYSDWEKVYSVTTN